MIQYGNKINQTKNLPKLTHHFITNTLPATLTLASGAAWEWGDETSLHTFTSFSISKIGILIELYGMQFHKDKSPVCEKADCEMWFK